MKCVMCLDEENIVCACVCMYIVYIVYIMFGIMNLSIFLKNPTS